MPEPLTPGPSPRKRGEGRTYWDRLQVPRPRLPWARRKRGKIARMPTASVGMAPASRAFRNKDEVGPGTIVPSVARRGLIVNFRRKRYHGV